VSARAGRNFEVLKESIYHALDIISIYTKVPGKEPDLVEPFVLKKGSTLTEKQNIRMQHRKKRVYSTQGNVR